MKKTIIHNTHTCSIIWDWGNMKLKTDMVVTYVEASSKMKTICDA